MQDSLGQDVSANADIDVIDEIDEIDQEFLDERRALGISIIWGFSLAALGLATGILTGSRVVLFDGLYAFIGIGLTGLAVRVSQKVEAGPTKRYPFGRESLTPLIIGFEGVALLVTCVFAAFDAIVTIRAGGSDLPSGGVVAYAAISTIVPLFVGIHLHKRINGSELVAAEALQWLIGALLGLGMLIGFVGAQVVDGTSLESAVPYVDPVLVLLASALFIGPPLKMVRTMLVELLEAAPDAELLQQVRDIVDEARIEFQFGQHNLRVTKTGPKFYVEIDILVSPDWTVRESDEVRKMLLTALDDLPETVWMTLEFTAVPEYLD
jgi:cation diffusion facilitator family transporter